MRKIIGSTEPVINEVAKLTPGLGFELISVDDGGTSGIGIATELVLDAQSSIVQDPVGVDNPLQVTFGNPVVTPDVSMDANGNLQFAVIDDWDVTIRLVFNRVTSPGVAILFVRNVINGTPGTKSIAVALDDGGFDIPLEFTTTFRSAVSDVLTFEIYRDSAGINNGGLRPRTATLAGWGDSPSARILLRRSVVRTEPNMFSQTFDL